MKSNKLGTILLILVMVFTITFAAGCESKEDPKEDPGTQVDPGKTDPGTQTDPGKTEPEKKEETKKVKLLKRNGVEWKENTKINSYVGAKQYTVVWGDTLSLIARTWKVNCYRLARYNGIKNIDLIEVGQVIKNPAAK